MRGAADERGAARTHRQLHAARHLRDQHAVCRPHERTVQRRSAIVIIARGARVALAVEGVERRRAQRARVRLQQLLRPTGQAWQASPQGLPQHFYFLQEIINRPGF